MLWNDNGTPRKESVAQDLFLGIVEHYCKANNIDISREPNIGRGPVDFKTSQGFWLRALLEVKLAKYTKFWSGIQKQLPKYLEAEEITYGLYLVVYTDADFEKITGINNIVMDVCNKTRFDIACIIIDARESPLSASRL